MLTIELVPATAWWSNVRSNVTSTEWSKCKRYSRAKTPGGACIICGGVGPRYPSEAHEIWHYDDARGIQTLIDIWPLCPLCHQVKHLGRTRMHATPRQWARVIGHLQRVNAWPDWKVEKAVQLAFEIWELRSQTQWKLDVSFLTTIGIDLGNRTLERASESPQEDGDRHPSQK